MMLRKYPQKIKYPMLVDPTGALSRALGVYIEEEGMAYRGIRSKPGRKD